MAAPTAPAGLVWVPDDTTQRQLQLFDQVGASTGQGWVDDQDQHVVIVDDNNDLYVYYSTDGGSTWSASGSNPVSLSVGAQATDSMVTWVDPETGYVAMLGSDGGGDLQISVYEWDSGAQTLTFHDSVEYSIGSGSVAGGGIIGGWDTGDSTHLYLVSVGYEDGTVALGTFLFETDTDTLTQQGSTQNIGATNGDFYENNPNPANFGVVHSDGDNPYLMPDPLSDTIYMFGAENGSLYPSVWALSWNGANSRFEIDTGPVNIVTDEATFTGGVQGWFSPNQNKWYASHKDQSNGDEMDVFECDGTDPTVDTWSRVAAYDVDKDDVSVSLDGSGRGSQPAYDFGNDTIYWLRRGEDGGSTDQDFYQVAYDVVADTFTTTAIGFSDADMDSTATLYESNGFHPYKGDGSAYVAAFVADDADWGATSEDYSFFWAISETSIAAGGGWGFIPIGG